MNLVQQLLDHKGSQVVSIAPEASVLEALKLMAEKAIGSLVVMKDDSLVGVITERDYARKVIIKGRTAEVTPVAEIMSTEVITISPGQTVKECMTIMSERRIRHLPVMENGQVVGLVSIGDLVQAIIRSQQAEIEQLEQYISG